MGASNSLDNHYEPQVMLFHHNLSSIMAYLPAVVLPGWHRRYSHDACEESLESCRASGDSHLTSLMKPKQP